MELLVEYPKSAPFFFYWWKILLSNVMKNSENIYPGEKQNNDNKVQKTTKGKS